MVHVEPKSLAESVDGCIHALFEGLTPWDAKLVRNAVGTPFVYAVMKLAMRPIVLNYVNHARGNVSRAANRMGIDRNTLNSLIRKTGIRNEVSEIRKFYGFTMGGCLKERKSR